MVVDRLVFPHKLLRTLLRRYPINPLKTKVTPELYMLNSYRSPNTFRLGYKRPPFNIA